MSKLQEQVISRVSVMSDADAGFLLDIINRLIPQKTETDVSEKMRAFQRLEDLRGGFPEGFDADKELAQAREEKYGSINKLNKGHTK